MNDLRRRIDSKRKPVPDAVGNDQAAFAALIKPRPIMKHRRTEPLAFVQHQLATMCVAGKRQRQLGFCRGIESVRMVRHQYGESIRLSLLQKPLYRSADGDVTILVRPCPTETEKLQRNTAHTNNLRFIEQERDSRSSYAPLKLRRIFDEIVVPLDEVTSVTALHGAHELNPVIKIGQLVVDQIAGVQNEVGAQFVYCRDNLGQHFSRSEAANVNIADLRDGEAVQLTRQICEAQREATDTKLAQLPKRQAGQAERKECRSEPPAVVARNRRSGTAPGRSGGDGDRRLRKPPDSPNNYDRKREEYARENQWQRPACAR